MLYEINKLYNLDCMAGMKEIEDNSIDCIITSPPYNKKGLHGKVKATKNYNKGENKKSNRYKYHEKGNQIWSKFEIDYETYGDNLPEEAYQQWMTKAINEMVRIIKPTGSIFFNHKPRRYKNEAHLPTDFIRSSNARIYQVIVWNRKNSPNIRNDILVPCVEYVYWLAKKKPKVLRKQIDPNYKTVVWDIPPLRQGAHPAPFPPKLVENCVNLTTVEGDLVLDPFMGSGTTAAVAQQLKRNWIGFEIDPKYTQIFNQTYTPKEDTNE